MTPDTLSNGPGGEAPGGGDFPFLARDLDESLERMDVLLASVADFEKLRAGLGIRLALGLARELKQGLPLGTETAALVALWTEEHGQDTVDVAVKVAREFLVNPDALRRALEQRLRPEQNS